MSSTTRTGFLIYQFQFKKNSRKIQLSLITEAIGSPIKPNVCQLNQMTLSTGSLSAKK